MLSGTVVYPAGIFLAVFVVVLGRDWPRTFLALVAVAHATILTSVALFPLPIDAAILDEGRSYATLPIAGYTLNLVPFATIGPVLAGLGPPGSTQLLLLNLFVLFPAGIYLPLLVPPLRRPLAVVPLVVIGGASIELLQLAVSTVIGYRYRSIDVDDAILNGAGLALGWLVVVLGLAVHSRAQRGRP